MDSFQKVGTFCEAAPYLLQTVAFHFGVADLSLDPELRFVRPRTIAGITPAVWSGEIRKLSISVVVAVGAEPFYRPANMLELSTLKQVYRVCRYVAGLGDVGPDVELRKFEREDYLAVDSGVDRSGSGGGPSSSAQRIKPSPKGKVLKFKEYITQTDDSEVEMVADAIVKQWKDAYRRQMNDMNPEPEEEASPEQVCALNARLQSGASCGAEFAVWFPYHTRVNRNTKFDVAQMIEGNKWVTREIKGPSSLHY